MPADLFVCLGDVMVECLLPLPFLPPKNRTFVLEHVPQQIGGSAYNLCWNLSYLGHPTWLTGIFGRNDNALVEAALRHCRTDPAGLIPFDGDSDLLIAMIVDGDHHSLYVRARPPVDIWDQIATRVGEPPYLLLAGSRHEELRQVQVHFAQTCRQTTVVFSPSYAVYEYRHSQLAALLQSASITTVNASEAEYLRRIFNFKSTEEWARQFPNLLLLTRGEEGADLYRQKQKTYIPSYSRKSGDALGAGDAFLGGFLHALTRQADFVEAAKFAAATAAVVVEAQQVRVPLSESMVLQWLPLSPNER